LVIDDEEDVREALHTALEADGAEARVAASAAEARGLLQCWRPDVVLCDISMPGEDGIKFLASTRELPNARGVGAIAMTALRVSPELEERIAAVGFRELLRKPFACAQLQQVIARVAGRLQG
jgi:CheY-like chemotaxis protein